MHPERGPFCDSYLPPISILVTDRKALFMQPEVLTQHIIIIFVWDFFFLVYQNISSFFFSLNFLLNKFVLNYIKDITICK